MIQGTAYFECLHATAQVKLSTGETVKVITALRAEGNYKSWWEYPCEPQHGSMQFVEQDVDNETATALFPDEFEFYGEDSNKNIDDYDGIIIESVENVIDADWQVDEDTIDEGEDF